ncbi:hypothetical protein ASF91_15195 [Rhizobium sp. Leaf155]|nr:hypothetical protein ASF91_15195 [Rhizobium sp. Leaf155]
MSVRDTLTQLERLALIQDEMHRRLLEELRAVQAEQEAIASFLQKTIELRNLRSAAIVEAAAVVNNPNTGAGILNLFKQPAQARTLQ